MINGHIFEIISLKDRKKLNLTARDAVTSCKNNDNIEFDLFRVNLVS